MRDLEQTQSTNNGKVLLHVKIDRNTRMLLKAFAAREDLTLGKFLDKLSRKVQYILDYPNKQIDLLKE